MTATADPATTATPEDSRATSEDNSKKRGSAAVSAGDPQWLREHIGVVPTPPPDARLSANAAWDEAAWDEATRPVGPAPDPGAAYSAAGRSHAQDLVAVHDHLRAELAQLRDMISQVAGAASMSPRPGPRSTS